MSQDIYREFADRVSFEGLLHVGCEPAAPLEARELVLQNERNVSLLTTVTALSERRADTVDDDNAIAQELVRLDAKLNAVLELVNRLALPAALLPPRVAVKFNALAAEIPRKLLPQAGQRVQIRIHFDACRALPLELTGQVVASPGRDVGVVAFEGLSEAVREALEKLVFRQHRRQVAEARQAVRSY
jgi:hypothetical protein